MFNPFLAASIQLLISTASHAVKEAQTYLSLVVFAPMAVGMFMVFSPAAKWAWLGWIPLVGQQLQLEAAMSGYNSGWLEALTLGLLTVFLAILGLKVSTNRLRRDEILYGN